MENNPELKTSEYLKGIVLNLPESPGIYQYLNTEGVIIYVGKAKNLKRRVSSYFNKEHEPGKTRVLVSKIAAAELAAKQAAEAAPEAAEAAQPNAAKPELLDFLASEPEAENDPFADQPTKTAPELPELTPAQELAGYIRARSAAALITPHALLLEEVENADELLAQMPADPQCTDIVTRAGAKDIRKNSSCSRKKILIITKYMLKRENNSEKEINHGKQRK